MANRSEGTRSPPIRRDPNNPYPPLEHPSKYLEELTNAMTGTIRLGILSDLDGNRGIFICPFRTAGAAYKAGNVVTYKATHLSIWVRQCLPIRSHTPKFWSEKFFQSL